MKTLVTNPKYGITVGEPVWGGTNNRVLFVDGNGLLADDAGLTYDGTDLTLAGDLYLSGLTEKSVPFIGAGGLLSEDNANFFYDSTLRSLSLGDVNFPTGTDCFAGGKNTTAAGSYTLAFGLSTIANGVASFATGNQAQAIGNGCVAMGQTANATGLGNTAIGFNVQATGILGAIAMGASTVSSGISTVAMGGSCQATGAFNAVAMGANTVASGSFTFCAGQNTVAQAQNSVAFGRFNVGGGSVGDWVSTETLFELGKGTSDGARDNSFQILKDGTVNMYSDVGGRQFIWDAVTGTVEILGTEAGTYPYAFNINSSASPTSYMGIFNDGGTSYGAFFGMENEGGANGVGDTFGIWNYQGGGMEFNVSTSASQGLHVMRYLNEGYLVLGSLFGSNNLDLTQKLPNGWNDISGSYGIFTCPTTTDADSGFFVRGNAAKAVLPTTGFDMWIDDSSNLMYMDCRYDNDAGDTIFRTKTEGTPIEAMRIRGTGLVAFDSLTASKLVKTDASKNLASTDATVQTPISFETYDAEPARSSESNIHGGLLSLATAQALDSAPTNIIITKGIGKVMIVVNAGSDLAGDITITGTSVDRDTGATQAGDTDTITVDAISTDASDTDSNGNTRHSFTGAYITSKWFTGTVTLSTVDLTLTDVDVYHVSFEQFNDAPILELDTFDINLFTTSVNAEFDAYLYDLHVTGDKCTIERHASLNIGADGETAIANKYWRLRKGSIGQALDGTTDGVWVDVHYSNSPAYVEDVTVKVWALCTSSVILS